MRGRQGDGARGRRGNEQSLAPSPAHPVAPSAFSPCCQASARRYLRKHRDVATCDTCGMLLLAYGNERDYDETRKALTEQGTPFSSMTQGSLKVIAKPRVGKARGRR